MARLRVSVDIDAPPERVWADLQDIASHAEWMTEAVAIRFLSDQTSGVGTRYECDTKVGPFRLTDVMEITEWKPGRAMGVVHSGLVTGDGEFSLKRLRGGRTRFRWTERLHFPLAMGGPVGASVGKRVLRKVWRRNLQNLAARF